MGMRLKVILVTEDGAFVDLANVSDSDMKQAVAEKLAEFDGYLKAEPAGQATSRFEAAILREFMMAELKGKLRKTGEEPAQS